MRDNRSAEVRATLDAADKRRAPLASFAERTVLLTTRLAQELEQLLNDARAAVLATVAKRANAMVYEATPRFDC